MFDQCEVYVKTKKFKLYHRNHSLKHAHFTHATIQYNRRNLEQSYLDAHLNYMYMYRWKRIQSISI